MLFHYQLMRFHKTPDMSTASVSFWHGTRARSCSVTYTGPDVERRTASVNSNSP